MLLTVIFCLFILGSGTDCFSKDSKPEPSELSIKRFSSAPKVDGMLTESCWQEAKELTGFYLIGETKKAKIQTSAYIGYDDNNLYIGFTCLDPDTRNIIKKLTDRDDPVWDDDCVEILIDANNDGKTYYHFGLNAAGTKFDSADIMAQTFDADWQAKTHISGKMWTAELSIPFYNFVLAGNETWRIDLRRKKQKNPAEYSSWAYSPKVYPHTMDCFGYIKNLELNMPAFVTGIILKDKMLSKGKVGLEIKNVSDKNVEIEVDMKLISQLDKVKTYSARKKIKRNSKETVSLKYSVNEEGFHKIVTSVVESSTGKKIYVAFENRFIYNKKSHYPRIDVHTHLRPKNELTGKIMDMAGIAQAGDLSAGRGDELRERTSAFNRICKGRVIAFTVPDFDSCKTLDDAEYSRKLVEDFEQAVKDGATGIKV